MTQEMFDLASFFKTAWGTSSCAHSEIRKHRWHNHIVCHAFLGLHATVSQEGRSKMPTPNLLYNWASMAHAVDDQASMHIEAAALGPVSHVFQRQTATIWRHLHTCKQKKLRVLGSQDAH